MTPPKTIRTSKGDILNELKRRHSIEGGDSQFWRIAKKHYIPNVIGHAGALTLATQAIAAPYKAIQKDRVTNAETGKDFAREGFLYAAPELAAFTLGTGIGIRSGRLGHKREKLMSERLKEHHKDDLFNQLSDRGKEDYALFLGKTHGAPILKELMEKRKKENEAVKEFKRNYQNQISLNHEDGEEKQASLSKIALSKSEQALKDWGMGNPEKMKKDEIYDELIARRMEAVGKKPSGFKRRDFKESLKNNLKNPSKLVGHGIVSAFGALHAHNNYKDHLKYLKDNPKVEDDKIEIKGIPTKIPVLSGKKAAIFTTPLILGPGLHAAHSALSAGSETIQKSLKRKKNRFELADFTTDELERKLGRNLLTKLYREHGAEGEEHTS